MAGDIRKPAIAVAVVVLLLLGVLAATALRSAYTSDRDAATARAQNLALVLEEHTLRAIQAVDLLLLIVADGPSKELDDHDPDFEDWLRDRLQQLPHVRALFIIGPDGFITQDTDHPATPQVSLADRDYFKFHQRNSESGLHLARPLLSRSVNRWFMATSRRLDTADGSFGGIVVAAVEPYFYEHFYRELALGSADAIALWHTDGTLIARVPVDFGLTGEKAPWAQVFGQYLPKQSVGTFLRQSPFDPPDQRVVSYRQMIDVPLVVTVSLSRAADLSLWWQLVYGAVAGSALLIVLTFTTLVLIFRRIRERAEAEARFAATQNLEMLGQMTAGIAHDFNNILAAVGAGLRLASENTHDRSRLQSYIEAANDALGRGANLTRQLLGSAKRRDIDLQTADANELLSNSEPMLRYAAGPNIKINLELAPALSSCRVDAAQFDAAILNLVINARDAMPERGQVTISTVRWEQKTQSHDLAGPGAYVLVRVKDNGPGISPDVLDKVFKPFFTTKGERGTGLGLPQVQGFMRKVGGAVRIESEPGQGTMVELYFPCEDEP